MTSRNDAINEVRAQVGGDATYSMIDAVFQNFGDDKAKVLEFFQASVGGDQVNASFEQCVEFLKKAMPIYGAPDSLYEDCVRRANNDISIATDLLMQARDQIRYDRHSPSKPLPPAPKGPTASPIVSPPVYNPAAAPKPSAPAAKPSAPAPAAAAAAAEKPKEPPKKALPAKQGNVASADEVAKQKEAEFYKLIESQRKEAEERSRQAQEQEKYLRQLQEKQEQIAARIKSKEAEPSEISDLEVQLHRCEIEQSRLQSQLEVRVPPDYMIGRLPTDECEIVVTVNEMLISFTWKIADKIQVNAKDWIGLYIHDRQYSNKYESYVTLGGKREGSASFTAPTIGYYDLRYYPNNGSVERSRSEPFIVGPKMNVQARLQGRRKIAVSWDRGLQTADGDWLALYPVSTYSNTKYLQQIPASSANSDGVITFDAPRQPGEYEVRYFFTSKRHATGYAYSGKSETIVIPNEDMMEVVETHPIVKVHWQTFSQEPNTSDWIGVYDSSDDRATRLGWEYLSKKGLMDTVGDHGYAEIEVKKIMCLDPKGKLPEECENWEIRLFNKAPNQPFLRIPFLKH